MANRTTDEPMLTTSGFPTYGRTPRPLLRAPGVSAQAKALWALIEDFASPDSPAPWPSQATLAEYLGVEVRTIQRWQDELTTKGWLRVLSRPGHSNRYELMWISVGSLGISTHDGSVTPDTSVVPPTTLVSGVGTTPVSYEEEPVEEEPSKKPSTKASAPNPNQQDVNNRGWESDDETRETTVAIIRRIGLDSNTRTQLGPIVHEARQRGMTGQQIYELSTSGNWNKVGSPTAVIRHRLAGATA